MQADLAVGMLTGNIDDLSQDVARIGIVFVNAYLLGAPGQPWVLVDTGMAGSAERIVDAATERWGANARPEAIILTHAHPDHVGNALELATRWNVTVYLHPLEIPFVNGESQYPPADPTVGGAMAFMSRFMPPSTTDLHNRVRPLPDDGTVPGAEGWRWIHTPGHTNGHIALFRDRDRCLIAGDAFATVDLDSWSAITTMRPQFSRPAATFTPDWPATLQSIAALAALEPRIVGAGHGLPMYGTEATDGLNDLAATVAPPPHGRYVDQPVRYDEHGVLAVPPPVVDHLPHVFFYGLLAVVALLLSASRAHSRHSRNR